MKKLSLLLALAALLAPAIHAEAKPKRQHVPAVERYPEARCEQVRQSVLADLPHFCQSDKSDQIRLIDFGNQINLLDKKCGMKELAEKLRRALNEKVHRKNKSACIVTAEEMVRIQPNKAKASASEESF